ncbi:MAG: hypothetical protein A3A26_02005 [Candidatus Zambryskibacteria bacterium RIFCSPLOWO2_01_FULL_47_14]|uniref:Prepilin peptidase n=1 Tax=Candidatus Zambryskibacteria bacterium RIFCSPLOWO2_01_FULL_47_14 TaxID=1802763 RepID=A0A1G2U8L2_9BACT|nr:MAG: hypothetical protein A3A26_02005 [Candidatus Zambryskibacteria bacterium RIFCSPLOWO2_01_FULL_47_14]
MTTVILFIFGATVGSFLNVVALRYPALPLGRSVCPKCGKRLQWFELPPFFSFLVLGGRCRTCKTKISLQYPIIELWTGLVFATVPHLLLPVFCIYIIIAIYDFRHKIIPDALVYSTIVLSVAFALLNLPTYQLIDLAAGPLLFLFFSSIWLLTGGRAIGFGDAKLALSIGFLFGAGLGFSAAILAFWIGALTGIVGMLFSRKNITMKSEMPFAPFLVLGSWLALILNLDLLHVSSF